MQSQNTNTHNNAQHFFGPCHYFDTEFATAYGIQEAIIIKHIIYWIDFNMRKGSNFIEGRTWMYQTQEEMAHHFPYWDRRQVMRILKSLIDSKLLIAKNHNKNKQIKTMWYALVDEKMFINVHNRTFQQREESTEENPKTTFESPKMDSPNPKMDSPRQKVDYLICKDTKTDAKTKTAAIESVEKNSSSPKAVTAAASSGEEKKTATKKVIAKPSALVVEKTKRSEALESLDIPISEKEWLLEHHNLPAIELSIAWATHPTTHIKKTVIQAIKWFLAQNPKDRPKTPQEKESKADINKQTVQNMQKHLASENYEIHVLNKHVSIEPKTGMGKTIEIQYDNECFEKIIQDAMKQRGFRRIIKQ